MRKQIKKYKMEKVHSIHVAVSLSLNPAKTDFRNNSFYNIFSSKVFTENVLKIITLLLPQCTVVLCSLLTQYPFTIYL